jgi:putative hemolysin
MSVDLLIILLLVLANGVFSMSEMAVVAARKARLEQRAEAGDPGARAALTLAKAPTRFLSTVQLGITLIGIVAGAFGGAALSETLAARLRQIPLLAPYSDAVGFGLVVLLITYLSLVLGELVPKRLALNNAERVAALVARPMGMLSVLAAPLVKVLSVSTDLVLRLLRARSPQDPPVTEEEVRLLLEEGTEAGVFAQAEQDLVEHVFRLADRRVDEIMTPRPKIVWLDVDAPPAENARRMADSPHAQFPVCRGDLDHVLGIVSVKEVWARVVHGEPPDVTGGMRPPVYVPESLPALKALEAFKASGMHAALVLDEYGGTEGLVTLIDVLEAIVGDLPAPGQAGAGTIVRRADGSWLVDGLTPVDEVTDLLGIDLEAEAEREGYQTMGGFVMAHLGRIPSPGDTFVWHGLRVEVIDMDGQRVDKILIVPLPTRDGPP